MTDFIAGPLPLWAEILTAVLAVAGAAFAAIGSFGLVRLPTFFRRIHAPTLGSTLGAWCITLATTVYFSVQGALRATKNAMSTACRKRCPPCTEK